MGNITAILLMLASLITSVAGVFITTVPTLSQVQPRTRFFPETTHTVKGRFLEYWEAHGGLSQQGYPISEEMQEVSDTNGQVYTVQYFERTVFELHPENQPPYDVLLSLLGVFEYEERYGKVGAPDQKPNDSPGSVTFRETGKRLGGIFLQYWQTHGGLAQQGYPISDEFQEISPLDRKTYTVQYFERAVFDGHPENNGTPYEVLLSQLGKFHYFRRHGVSSGQPRLIARDVEDRPAGAGRYIFYLKNPAQSPLPSDRQTSLYGYDMRAQHEFLVSDSPVSKSNLATDGKVVVWTEGLLDEEGAAIRGRDLNTGRDFEITASVLHTQYGRSLTLDRGILYYRDKTPGHTGLYGHNLVSGNETLIAAGGYEPVAADGMLLWFEFTPYNLPQPGGPYDEWSLHLLKTDGSKGETIVARKTSQFVGYGVSGDHVVWATYYSDEPGEADRRANLYDIRTGANRPVSPDDVDYPVIKGKKVAWTSGSVRRVRSDNQAMTAVQAYDIDTGTATDVVKLNERSPHVWLITEGATLVYTIGDEQNLALGIIDLYILSLNARK